MKIGIIKERKFPPDQRVVFSPSHLVQLKQVYPALEVVVESADIRVFTDEEYRHAGIPVVEDLSACDVLLGVKEVPIEALIPHKKYFFFSHTIKKQPHNRKLLQAILEKKIDLYDHETIVDAQNKRLIGFGYYAGIVGAYNGFRAFGVKFDLYNLPQASTLHGTQALIAKLNRLTLPPIKIVLTGKGKVATGAKYILDAMKMKQVGVDDFLTKHFDGPVYVQIDIQDYYVCKAGGTFDKAAFYSTPSKYTSDFARFTKAADIFMAGHFAAADAPAICTQAMLAAIDNKIKVVADISCDVDGPVASTVRASTIAQPFYGYLPSTGTEVDFFHPAAIAVMAVDNLPCEIPRDASEGFGEMFLQHVIPAFFNNDENGILARAQITASGKLTPRFSYLQDYVNNIEK